MKTGRNDPCPCGSGKKYKQCCLQAREVQQAEDFLWHQISRAIRGLPDRLLTFEQKRRKPGALQKARSDFTFGAARNSIRTRRRSVIHALVFHNWRADFAAGRRCSDIRTTGQAFLDHYGKQLGHC